MKIKFLIFLSIISLCVACSKGNERNIVVVEHFIDSRLNDYFESFKNEAVKRNIQIDFEEMGIDGYIQSIRESGVAGQCQTYVDGSSRVQISPSYWRGASDLEREFLVFHELGHCALKRDHLDEANEDGTCMSMMNSGGEFCLVNYSAFTREQYIEELFSQ